MRWFPGSRRRRDYKTVECKQFTLLINRQTEPGHFLTSFLLNNLHLCEAFVLDGLISSPSTSVVFGFVRFMFVKFVCFLVNQGENRCFCVLPFWTTLGVSCVRRAELRNENWQQNVTMRLLDLDILSTFEHFVRAKLLGNSLRMSSLTLSLEWKRKLFTCVRSSDVSGMFEFPF